MTTKIYGQSDDNIYLEGDISDQLDAYDDLRLVFDDGTIIATHYGKAIRDGGSVSGIWALKVERQGSKFESFTECLDDEATVYSDVVVLKSGIRLVHVGSPGDCRNYWLEGCEADRTLASDSRDDEREKRGRAPLVIIDDGYVYVPYDSNTSEVRIELKALKELIEGYESER